MKKRLGIIAGILGIVLAVIGIVLKQKENTAVSVIGGADGPNCRMSALFLILYPFFLISFLIVLISKSLLWDATLRKQALTV